MSITFYPNDGSESGYGDPVPVIDAYQLYDECISNNITTGWWFPLANSSTLIAGEYPSEAYILVTKKYLDGCAPQFNNGVEVEPIDRARYNHKLVLHDGVRVSRGEDPITLSGWVFHSAAAIDGTNDPDDLDAVYLVKFVDKRWLFAKQANITGVSGALLYAFKNGKNVVAPEVLNSTATDNIDTLTFTPEIVDDFPYVPGTTGGISSYSWEQILNELWYESSFTDAVGSTMGFQDDLLPGGGVYPTQNPIDFLYDNKTTWSLFCELLHASGNEIYPWLDGTFRILPIDDHFGSDSELVDYVNYLIDANHPQPEELALPTHMTITMRARAIGGYSAPEILYNSYYTLDFPIKTYDGAVGGDTPALLDEDDIEIAEANGAYFRSGSSLVQEIVPGVIEDITTPAMAYLLGVDTSELDTHIDGYARDVCTKLLKSKADKKIDNTYGYFIGLSPSAEFERVSWFITPNGPATRFTSIPSQVGVEEVPDGGGGSGGGSDDHLVKADDDDNVPETFYTTVVDHDTFDEMLHQEVFAEVITESVGPPKNTRVKLFTTLGSGDQGPPGEQGDPGADGPTYTAGCGIIIASTTVAVFADELVGAGLQVDPYATTACSLAVDPADLVGCGLEVASDNVANTAVKIKVNPTSLAGCGLLAASDNSDIAAGPCKLKIDPEAIAGCGLIAASDNQSDGNGPCKIKIDITAIKNPDEGIDAATGNQDDANGPCKLKIKPNVTIKVPTAIDIYIDGTNVKVDLDYTEYEVYGIVGATGTLTGSTEGDEC